MRSKKWAKNVAMLGMLFAFATGSVACKSSEDYIAERLEEMNGGSTSEEEAQQADKVAEDIMANLADTDEKSEKKKVSFGSIQGGVYSNAYLGVSCNLGSDWMVYSAEELQGATEAVLDAMGGTELAEFAKDVSYIMDMKAECLKSMTTMNVVYTKMSKQEQAYYDELSEKEIVEKTLEGSRLIIDSYAQAGMNVKMMTSKTIDFLGEKRTVVYTSADIAGIGYYTLQIYDFHSGEYATTLTLASMGEDKTMELLNMFSKYE